MTTPAYVEQLVTTSLENARNYARQSTALEEGVTVDKAKKQGAEQFFLVRRNGTPIGFVTKIANTRSTTHPYKATVYDGYNPEAPGADTAEYKSTFLGVTYTPGKAGMDKAVAAVANRTMLKGDPITNEARKKTGTFKRSDCTVETWFERDRAHVSIECDGETVADWWDDDVQDMADSGYFTMGRGDRALEKSVLDYAVEMGLISEGVTEALSVPEQHQLKIAKSTLRMSDAGARIMGGMTKEQARQFLKTKAGWSDSKIKAFEGSALGEATENPELSAAMETLVKRANDLFPGGFVSGGAVLSIGTPVGKLKVHAKPRDQWTNGIFENGPSLSVLIQNDSERPVGPVSVLGNGEAPGGSTGRGSTYSVSFTSFAREFKPRVKNKSPLPKIVDHVLKTLMAFKSAVAPKATSEAGRPIPNYKLDADEVLSAYIKAALWSSTDDDGEPLDDKYDRGDIAPSTLASMKRDVEKFVSVLKRANDLDLDGWDSAQIGHDLWLSRNGHGAGFFDRDLPSADRLQKFASAMREVDLYVGDDGKVYAMRESMNESPKLDTDDRVLSKKIITQSGGDFSVNEGTTKVRSAISVNDYIRGMTAGLQGDGTTILFRKQDYDNKGTVTGPSVVVGKGEELYTALAYDWNEGFTMSKQEHADVRAKAARLAKSLAKNESLNEAGDVLSPTKMPKVGAKVFVHFGSGSGPFITRSGRVEDVDRGGKAFRAMLKGDEYIIHSTPKGWETEGEVVRVQMDESVSEGRDWDYERDGPGLLITAPDGRTCYLQGDEASELEDQLDAAKNQRQINNLLDAYDEMCESGRTFVLAKVKGDRDADAVAGDDKEEALDLLMPDDDSEVEYRTVTARDAGAARLLWRSAKPMHESGAVEYAIWGVPPGEREEDLLIAMPGGKPITSKSQAEKYKQAAIAKGATKVRIQTVDLSTPPNFGQFESVDAILEAKRKAKGIFRTGDNGVFFIANKDIDKGKVAKTDARMEKKYGKGFSKLSAGEKLKRIKSAAHKAGKWEDHIKDYDAISRTKEGAAANVRARDKADKKRYGKRASWNESLAESGAQDEITLVYDRNGEYLAKVTGGWAKGKSLDTVHLGRGADNPQAWDKLVREFGLGNRGIFVRDDGGAEIVPGYPVGVGTFVKVAKSLGVKVKVQESTMNSIAQNAVSQARRRVGLPIDEISTGSRVTGFLLSDAPEDEKRKIAPGGMSFVSPTGSNPVAEKIDRFIDSVDEAERLTKAELILMDRKRKKRERRGKGIATGKQRLAAKRNAKKAARALLKGSVQRKAAKTRMRRGKMRGE